MPNIYANGPKQTVMTALVAAVQVSQSGHFLLVGMLGHARSAIRTPQPEQSRKHLAELDCAFG
jgi:hypothetical protein